MNPTALLATLKQASPEERVQIGLDLVRRNQKGLFKLTALFYRDPQQVTCYHSNRYAAVHVATPDESWYTVDSIRADRIYLRPETEFDVMHADTRCLVCCDHVTALCCALTKPPEWQLKKFVEMGFVRSSTLEMREKEED